MRYEEWEENEDEMENDEAVRRMRRRVENREQRRKLRMPVHGKSIISHIMSKSEKRRQRHPEKAGRSKKQ